jgi:hypothetical protein
MTAKPAAQKAAKITAKQAAADRGNLVKARKALKGRPRTEKQLAASRRNLAKARRATHVRSQGQTYVTKKAAKAPAPDTWTRYGGDRALLAADLHVLPVCGPVALAEHLLAHTGAVVSASDIIGLWLATEGRELGELFEAARELGLGGERLSYFERCDPDAGVPGLVYGITLGTGRYHAALAVPGGMVSWCRLLPRDGTPEEAWWLEWEGD